jgi:thiamine biosynthesis protein ThiI
MTDPRRFALITYDEIALKGKNRRVFIRRLLENIAAITGLPRGGLRDLKGRIQAELPEGAEFAQLSEALRRVFGIKWFAETIGCAPDYEAIESAAVTVIRQQLGDGGGRFKIEAKRKDKSFPIRSYDLACRLGDAIRRDVPGAWVDLSHPDAIVYVEVYRQETLVYGAHQAADGGLPVGSTGKALVLTSGGIDSPVAAWQLMKRGIEVECIYFASPPYTGVRAQQKVEDLVATLSRWAPAPITLHVARFTEIQEAIAEKVPGSYWTILHRRFMQRIASRIAETRGCGAIATGDSLGQVASQTLENMRAIDAATDSLVLRPLLGLDKQETIELATSIGTYEISIRPYEDCCVLFAPQKPQTRAHSPTAGRHEARLEVDRLVEEAVERTEVTQIGREASAEYRLFPLDEMLR